MASIDRTFIGEIERGVANPSFEVVERIASGLGVKMSDLVRAYEQETDRTTERRYLPS